MVTLVDFIGRAMDMLRKMITVVLILLLLNLFAGISYAKVNWVKVPGTDGMYVDENEISYYEHDNSISCVTCTKLPIDNQNVAWLVLGEVYYYNNHSNTILWQLLKANGRSGTPDMWPPEKRNPTPIKLGSNVEKVYYFIYELAKKQGKV